MKKKNILKLHRINARANFKSHLWVNLCMCECVCCQICLGLPFLISPKSETHTQRETDSVKQQPNKNNWNFFFVSFFPRWFWVVHWYSKCACEKKKNNNSEKSHGNFECLWYGHHQAIDNWIDEGFEIGSKVINWRKRACVCWCVLHTSLFQSGSIIRKFVLRFVFAVSLTSIHTKNTIPFHFLQPIVFSVPLFCFYQRIHLCYIFLLLFYLPVSQFKFSFNFERKWDGLNSWLRCISIVCVG